MSISVVTICYNSRPTIERTIKSVIGQDIENKEYWIIDGGSSDGTLDIIKAYAASHAWINYVTEKDFGIYDAMNKGIARSTGSVVAILNSDDYYLHNDVLSQIYELFSTSRIDACFGNILYLRHERTYRVWNAGRQKEFLLGWMPPHPAFFVRREVYSRYGTYRLDCGTSADYEFMLRVLHKHKIKAKWIPRYLVGMEAGGRSNSGLRSRWLAIRDDFFAWEVNGLPGSCVAIPLKKLRKILQFFYAMLFRIFKMRFEERE